MIYIFLGLHFFLVSANLAWRAKGRERETGIKSGPPFPIKKKKKKRKKREVQTKVPVSEDVLVHQVASGLVLGGESKLLDRRVLLQGLDKHALRLAGDGLSLVGNPQLLDSVVLQQNLGQGLKTGATDATKKKYQEKKKRERVREGRFFKRGKGVADMLLSMLKLVRVLLVLSPSIRATDPVLSMAQLATKSSVTMVLLGRAFPSLARI